ncbi:MAG: indolepyruvate oxidoreductase subunit beta [Candidatus Bathycorpusculaceae bacterium]
MEEFNIVLAGVGGQGILLASEILGTAGTKEGLNVVAGEIHGLAQRGGSVVSTIMIGDKVLAPTILDGQADVILGFEPLETLRSLKYASGKTCVIVNDEKIPPPELSSKNLPYPSINDIIKKIHRFTKRVIVVEAASMAEKAGSSLTQNMVLVGALAATGILPIKKESIMEALGELTPKRHLEMNTKAFNLGYTYVEKLIQHALNF